MLLTPGPTPVPEFARKAMSDITIHHRTKEFEAIFEKTRKLLLEIYDMNEVLILASSGTGAMEACITNLTRTKALTINSGKFGERFGKICKAFNIDYTELKQEWDTPACVEDVINAVKNDKNIDSLFIQICESAGGLRHPVEEIAKEVKKINPNIMIIADGITALGVEKIDTSNIDALITGSQKAFMLPPGIAMIGLSNKAVVKIEEKPAGYYFNLASEIKNQKKNTTAYTAATTLIIGLGAILEKFKEIGFDNLYKQTDKRAKATQEALKAIGFRIYPKVPANAMTTAYTEQSNEIRKLLKTKYNVDIAGGQDHLAGKIFRINHMGLVEDFEASWAVNATELVLDELGIRTFDGTANRVFAETFYKGN
ncbi:Soluble hydrogenase 42 kDa subunit [Aliarcobacter thereius]|uniref:Alanine--glyoxylate aminotransferase family protein n=2 Tax=Aliarcobacter thereius TaxID=544718 RepID=A0A1C0B9V0_9BACT|nr:alanine--glyoxylate aminotransferase family protein [Aliarcobacter thereius]OCL88492.1 Soluble hydrogenase 42 kDa subunit [Aliarcobacter thereius]OCL91982.1 Soluble hydrogenase 42 kDa subunit [Aliarcobacter thereius]OCL94920.1 Soluble hydrogenase 42 kDa subunit [Aliarcobacter thereius LMG 24486]OCM00368.1 Soluble hydrogenase 42 kDa subunit [Aliarcobacter thereius]QBF15208.1 alanine--glyoxylate aminotransferase family protein [Aliarcobacter thereius LMG 24486]